MSIDLTQPNLETAEGIDRPSWGWSASVWEIYRVRAAEFYKDTSGNKVVVQQVLEFNYGPFPEQWHVEAIQRDGLWYAVSDPDEVGYKNIEFRS